MDENEEREVWHRLRAVEGTVIELSTSDRFKEKQIAEMQKQFRDYMATGELAIQEARKDISDRYDRLRDHIDKKLPAAESSGVLEKYLPAIITGAVSAGVSLGMLYGILKSTGHA